MDGSQGPNRTTWPEWHPPLGDAQAKADAEACLQCGGPVAPAPCVAACPTGIDIPGFILDIAQGRPADAARKIFSANILGATCARVCPVPMLCEGSCVLTREGRRPIQIGKLQRFATDRAMRAKAPVTPTVSVERRPESVGVIGAGPAGLACAAELARLGYPVTVYEQRQRPGGLVTHGIAPYKLVDDPLPLEVEAIQRMGVTFRFGATVGLDVTADTLRRDHRAVFLGAGLADDLPVKIPGEDLPGVWESLKFIEAIRLRPPGETHLGNRIAVIGGGNTAIDVAREARMMGAADVMMLYRRTEAQMPAYAHELVAAKAEGVKIVTLVAPLEFLGWERVRGVRCIRMELGPPDSSGRPKPVPVMGSEFIIDVDAVIKAIGQRPQSDLLKHLGLPGKDGVVTVNEDVQTSDPWLFAGGDCINGGGTVVVAVRDGVRAARAIDRILSGRARPAPAPAPPLHVERDDGTLRHFQGGYRLTTVPALCKGCNICVTGCPTDTLSLDAHNRIAVNNPNTCVFCGLCEARCPDFAIWVAKGERAATPAGAGAAS